MCYVRYRSDRTFFSYTQYAYFFYLFFFGCYEQFHIQPHILLSSPKARKSFECETEGISLKISIKILLSPELSKMSTFLRYESILIPNTVKIQHGCVSFHCYMIYALPGLFLKILRKVFLGTKYLSG